MFSDEAKSNFLQRALARLRQRNLGLLHDASSVSPDLTAPADPPRVGGGLISEKRMYILSDDSPLRELFVPAEEYMARHFRAMQERTERELLGLPDPATTASTTPAPSATNILDEIQRLMISARGWARIERWGVDGPTWAPCTAWHNLIAEELTQLEPGHLYRLVAESGTPPPVQFIALGPDAAGVPQFLLGKDGGDIITEDGWPVGPSGSYADFIPPDAWAEPTDFGLGAWRRGVYGASLPAWDPAPILDPGPPELPELSVEDVGRMLAGAFGEPTREGNTMTWRPTPAGPPAFHLSDLHLALGALGGSLSGLMYVRPGTAARIRRAQFEGRARRNTLRHQRRNARWRHHHH